MQGKSRGAILNSKDPKLTFKLKQQFCTIGILLLAYIPFTCANISGVMGPNIDATDRSIQFRSAMSATDDYSHEDAWAYRLHYQHAFNDTFRGRIVLQYRDKGTLEYDFLRTELLYNFKKRGQDESWSSALRFDLRTRHGGRPEELAVNWGNEWALSSNYRMRATVILGQHLGGARESNDLLVQTRASFSRKLDNGIRVGIQMLNQHGELGDFGSINDQSIYLGPSVSGKIGEFVYELRYLNGLTDNARDNNFFFRMTTKL